jgi:hypothetical protein
MITAHPCVQVGIVGYTTPDTPFLSSPGPTITFLPLYPSVQNAVNEVRHSDNFCVSAQAWECRWHQCQMQRYHCQIEWSPVAATICERNAALYL